MMLSTENTLDRLVQTSEMYLFLSTLLRLPTKEMVELIQDKDFVEGIFHGFTESGLDESAERSSASENDLFDAHLFFRKTCQALNDEDPTILLSQLRSEYTSLFDHPTRPLVQRFEYLFLYFEKNTQQQSLKGVPPQYINPAAMDAERCYKEAGFARSSLLNEPGDSLTTELEFMHMLYEAKIASNKEADVEKSAFADACITKFMRTHLDKWALSFFNALVNTSRIAFYQALGMLGVAFYASIMRE